jgi:phosphatidylinositol alpha-1,6-mannosyltransferase
VAPADGTQPTGPGELAPGEALPAAGPHTALPRRRLLAAWFGAFAVYAGVMITTRHADGTWAVWGCGAYAVTALLLLLRTGWVIPLAAAIGGALVAPVLWLITTFPPTGEVVVIGQSASYLLKHGTPYLPPALVTSWTSYNPYLPLMEIFGLPKSAGFPGVLGDPRTWTTLTTIVVLAAAFSVAAPHRVRDCRDCRNRVAWRTAVAVASPLIAFPLAVGVTDPPIIALTCLVLALADQGKLVRAGVALAVACAMKTTAWAVVPVLAVMAWVRYAPRAAARFTGTTVVLTALLALVAAPAALATPTALKQNLIDYPLGTTKCKTVAASPLPGHLIAGHVHGGRLIVDVLLLLAVAAFVAWLLVRPPRDGRDAAVRLAVGYAVLFTLDPSTRFGYFAYPLALVGWLALSKSKSTSADPERELVPPSASTMTSIKPGKRLSSSAFRRRV